MFLAIPQLTINQAMFVENTFIEFLFAKRHLICIFLLIEFEIEIIMIFLLPVSRIVYDNGIPLAMPNDVLTGIRDPNAAGSLVLTPSKTKDKAEPFELHGRA